MKAVAAIAPVYAKANNDIWDILNIFCNAGKISRMKPYCPYRSGYPTGAMVETFFGILSPHAMTPGNFDHERCMEGTTKQF